MYTHARLIHVSTRFRERVTSPRGVPGAGSALRDSRVLVPFQTFRRFQKSISCDQSEPLSSGSDPADRSNPLLSARTLKYPGSAESRPSVIASGMQPQALRLRLDAYHRHVLLAADEVTFALSAWDAIAGPAGSTGGTFPPPVDFSHLVPPSFGVLLVWRLGKKKS